LYIIKTKPGRENRALQDIMDAIFTYDMEAEPINPALTGLVLIKTKLSYEEINKILKEYPIRTILSIEKTIKHVKMLGENSLSKALSLLFEELAEGKVKIRRVKVRCLGDRKSSENYVRKLVDSLLAKYKLINEKEGKDLILSIVNKYVFIKTIE